jgi:hypothetical protein
LEILSEEIVIESTDWIDLAVALPSVLGKKVVIYNQGPYPVIMGVSDVAPGQGEGFLLQADKYMRSAYPFTILVEASTHIWLKGQWGDGSKIIVLEEPSGAVAGAASEASLAALLAAVQSYVRAEDSPHTSGEFGIPMFGIRSDADIPTANDGDYTFFKLDEKGRLKVASMPASIADVTGDINAVQAALNGPLTAGAYVEIDVSRISNLMLMCRNGSAFAGINCSFEATLEPLLLSDGITPNPDANLAWFSVQAIRSNANIIETSTGALSAQPAYGWELSVNALQRFRVRCTARTSGVLSWRFKAGPFATEPIPGAQISGTQPISGTVTATVTAGTVNPVVPATPYFLNSAASTNGALILTGTSNLSSFYATNIGASAAYIKLYNKATAPVVGTDVPEMIIPVPAAVSGVPGVAQPPIGFHGLRFPLGLGIAITGGSADNDTTAVAVGQVKVKLSRTV